MRRFSSLKGKNALRLKNNMGLSREEERERGEEGEGEGCYYGLCLFKIFSVPSG